MQMHIKTHQQIHFIYLGNMDITAVLRHAT
jgi:hypothetical protein